MPSSRPTPSLEATWRRPWTQSTRLPKRETDALRSHGALTVQIQVLIEPVVQDHLVGRLRQAIPCEWHVEVQIAGCAAPILCAHRGKGDRADAACPADVDGADDVGRIA